MKSITRQQGFTLIEILAVITIMGIMAMVLLPRYLSNKKAKAMDFAKVQIVNDIRYVQNSTLTGMRIPEDDLFPQGGFGINIKKGDDHFMVFGDKNSNGIYDGSGDVVLETVSLEGGTYVSKLEQCADRSCSSVTSYPAKVDYVCLPPYGSGIINNTIGKEIFIRITLSTPSGDMQSNFIISSTGYTSYTG